MNKTLNIFSKIILPTAIFIFVSILFFSCKKDDNSAQSLDLEVVLDSENGIYNCNWTEVNTSSFVEYFLVYSSAPIPEEYDPSVGASGVLTGRRIEDFTQNIFALNPSRRYPEMYFQVIIDLGNRYLRTNQVELADDLWQTININPSRAIHHPEKNAFYIFEYISNRFIYYDYLEKRIVKEVNLDFIYEELKFGDNGLGEELYLIHDEYYLTILDANTLEEKLSFQFPYKVHSIASNEKGMLVVAAEKNDGPIQIYKRSDMSVLNTLDFSDHTVIRGVEFLSKDDNKLVETGRFNHHVYEVDDNGELLSHITAGNPYKKSGTNNNISVSPSGNYFVNTRFGEVYDADLNPIKCLVNDNEYVSYSFQEDQDYFYALRKNTVWTYRYDMPNITNQEYHDEDGLHPILLFKINERVMMLFKRKSDFTVSIQPYYFQT